MLKLIKVEVRDAKKLLDVQRTCFYEYLEKYHDHSINTVNKTLEQSVIIGIIVSCSVILANIFQELKCCYYRGFVVKNILENYSVELC